MTILLCSRKESVLEKWREVLRQKWTTHQASSIQEIFSLPNKSPIELILLHRSMIDTAQLKEICSNSSGAKVFVLSDRPSDQEGTVCLQLGCVGYANTYIRPTRLVTAIENVQAGVVWIGNSLMQHLIKGLAIEADDKDGNNNLEKAPNPILESLSKREYQIASLVAGGLHNNEIAEELEIAERTVKAHLSSIYSKTHVRGRLNLALLMNSK